MRSFGRSHYFLIFTDWFVKSHIHSLGFSQQFFLMMFALAPVGPTICTLVALPGLAFPGYLRPSGRPMLMMAIWHNMGMALVVVHTFLGDVYILYGTYIYTKYPFVTNHPSNHQSPSYQTPQCKLQNYWLLNALGIYCTTHFTKKSPLFRIIFPRLLWCVLHFHLDRTAVSVAEWRSLRTRTWTDFARREKIALLQIRRKTGK